MKSLNNMTDLFFASITEKSSYSEISVIQIYKKARTVSLDYADSLTKIKNKVYN